MTTPENISPKLRAFCGSPPSFTRTKKVPAMEVRIPVPANTKGSNTAESPSKLSDHVGIVINAAPNTMVPMMEPT